MGLGFGFSTGLADGLMFGVAFGLMAGLVGGLASGLAHEPVDTRKAAASDALQVANAWLHLLLTRVVLAIYGRTPWHLMTFLQEAHDRGVLRQAGGSYQFRHAHLQDRLAHARRY